MSASPNFTAPDGYARTHRHRLSDLAQHVIGGTLDVRGTDFGSGTTIR
jgi:hypothetical protein